MTEQWKRHSISTDVIHDLFGVSSRFLLRFYSKESILPTPPAFLLAPPPIPPPNPIPPLCTCDRAEGASQVHLCTTPQQTVTAPVHFTVPPYVRLHVCMTLLRWQIDCHALFSSLTAAGSNCHLFFCLCLQLLVFSLSLLNTLIFNY